jgi:hypothetical protein
MGEKNFNVIQMHGTAIKNERTNIKLVLHFILKIQYHFLCILIYQNTIRMHSDLTEYIF